MKAIWIEAMEVFELDCERVGLRKADEKQGVISILLLEHFVKGNNERYRRDE